MSAALSVLLWALAAFTATTIGVVIAASVVELTNRRHKPIAPADPIPGLDAVKPAVAIFLAWASDPTTEDVQHLAEVRCEVARLMPTLADQLDRHAASMRVHVDIAAGRLCADGHPHDVGIALAGITACKRCGHVTTEGEQS